MYGVPTYQNVTYYARCAANVSLWPLSDQIKLTISVYIFQIEVATATKEQDCLTKSSHT